MYLERTHPAFLTTLLVLVSVQKRIKRTTVEVNIKKILSFYLAILSSRALTGNHPSHPDLNGAWEREAWPPPAIENNRIPSNRASL